MDLLKKLWPTSYKAKDVTGLIVAIVILAIMNFACWLVGLVIGFIPLINVIAGPIWGIVGWIVGVYTFIGAVIAILYFLKVLK